MSLLCKGNRTGLNDRKVVSILMQTPRVTTKFLTLSDVEALSQEY